MLSPKLKESLIAIPILGPLYLHAREDFQVMKTRLRKLKRGRSFDRTYFETVFQKQDPWEYRTQHQQKRLDLLLSCVPETKGCVVELGCAEGAFTRRLTTMTSKIIAVDLSFHAIQRAKRLLDTAAVRFIQADVVHLPFAVKFDVVICAGVLGYLPENELFNSAVQKISDLVSPNGTLILEHFWESIEGARPGKDIHNAFCEIPGFHLCNLIREKEYGISILKNLN